MCVVTLIKAVAVGIAGIGVGMAWKEDIERSVKAIGTFLHKTKKAYRDGEAEGYSISSPESCDGGLNVKTVNPDNEDENSELKGRLVAAERECGALKRECESLRLKLDEAKGRIEVSFPKLVKRLYLMSDQSDIKDILEENGLSLCTDFRSFTDGFMRIKNESVLDITLVRPALVRGDDLVMAGIVHVPMNEDGAEPPKKELGKTESTTVQVDRSVGEVKDVAVKDDAQDVVVPVWLGDEKKGEASVGESASGVDLNDDFVVG